MLDRTRWPLSLKAVDPTYTINTERSFQARNAKAYEVEILAAPSRAATMLRGDRPKPMALPEQERLLLGRPVDRVVICRDASPARIVASDPRWFALQKLWMSKQAKRNPLKRGKDLKRGVEGAPIRCAAPSVVEERHKNTDREGAAMRIVDAQIHTWGTGLPSNMSHRQVTHYTVEEAVAEMDAGGIDAAIIHPPGWDPNSTEMAFKAVRDYPGRFAVMGSLPLDKPDESKPKIARWREQPGMLGLRWTFLHEPARQWLADGSLDWLWSEAEKADVPVSMLCTDSLEDVGRIAERFPGLRLTVDHLGGRGGMTTLKDHAAMEHMPRLLALAKHRNIAVKATGAPGYSAEAYPFPIMQGYLRQIFDAFGPSRMFWGTDITKMPCSWRQCVTMLSEQPWLNDNDRRLIFGDAIRAWWGWK